MSNPIIKRTKIWSSRPSRYNIHNHKKKKRNIFPKLLWSIWIIIIIIGLIWIAWFYENIYKKLPPIENIDNLIFSQTTTINDRNWKLLYKLFEENRIYVGLEKTSPMMINAIIATEDKNFRTNPWIDIFGIARAAIHDITNPNTTTHWWSTLTQQLIKNILLTKDKTIERKLKEIVLAIKLNWYIKTDLQKKYNSLSSKEIDKKVKEKILEMYLNYIFMWNNSYGIESASKTYFWTSAQYLDVVQSSILAWIPQAPTKHNPFTNKESVMWELKIESMTWDIISFTWDLKIALEKEISNKLDEKTLVFDKKTEAILDYIKWLFSFNFIFNWNSYKITYMTWRKDVVLWRMFEDWYIDKTQLKEALIKGFDYKFNKPNIEIKAPHFVFYIIKELKEKYWEELIVKWWLTVTTSLDLDIQEVAESSVNSNNEYLEQKWANNVAMVYIDSKEWDVLAYVWSRDYNNDEIDWQVDMIQAERQPWSTIKPLIYSLWFMKKTLTLDTPTFDIPFKIWKDEPNNVDWKFLWLIPIRQALAYSRNIPAIKMYFAIWQEQKFKEFLKDLWITTLSDNINYGYPIAIWAWEVKMIELANAYTHLSAMWKPAQINPILEVRWPDWAIIYKKKTIYQNMIIPEWVAYLIRKILSDKNNFPSSWRTTYTYDWFPVATKSWTTDVKFKDNKKYPRDWWFATYTPSKVIMFWAWNTKWEHMAPDAYWWWILSPMWKNFLKEIQNKWYIKEETVEPKWISNLTVSRITGKLISSESLLPLDFYVKTIWYIESLPKEYDTTERVAIDKLCNWKISDLTPEKDRSFAYIPEMYTFLDWNRDLNEIKNRWERHINSWVTNNEWEESFYLAKNKILLTSVPEKECEDRELIKKYWKIEISLLKPTKTQDVIEKTSIWYTAKSPFKIKTIKFYIDWKEFKVYNYNNNEISDIKTIRLWLTSWNHQFKITAEDDKWYVDYDYSDITIIPKDEDNPFLLENNTTIKEMGDWTYNISLLFQDKSWAIRKWNITNNGITIKEFNWESVNFYTNTKEWLEYTVYDYNWNSSSWKLVF